MSLLEAASALAVRYLTPDQVLGLRARYHAARTRLSPLLRLAYGTFDSVALLKHLEERIGTSFEILMVHSSVNNMKPMYTDDPLTLVRMLIDFCGPRRTLVMPAFYFGDPAIGGPHAVFTQRPRFDLRRTPSQMGLATELFRRSRGVVQSRHPVYRVAALGPLAEPLTHGHERAGGATGPGTPFDFMAKRDTLIVGIGKPYEVLTQVHHAEGALGDDFPVPSKTSDPLPMTLVDGSEEIPFELRHRTLLWRRDMWKLMSIMGPQRLKQWTFHHVPMFATRAGDVTACLIEAARRGVTLYDAS